MNREEKQNKNRLRDFLADLKKLTERHGVEIGGCGECGSPWVTPVSRKRNAPLLLEHLTYCHAHKAYGAYSDHKDCE